MIKQILNFKICLLMALTMTSANLSAGEPKVILYPDWIYDQESEISKKGFLTLSREEQNQRLENLLLYKKRMYLGGQLLKAAKYMPLMLIGPWALTKTPWYKTEVKPHITPDDGGLAKLQLVLNQAIQTEKGAWSALGIIIAGGSITVAALKALGTTFANFDGYGPMHFMKELENKYARQKRFYQKDLQQSIESNFSSFRRLKDISNQNLEMVRLALDLPYDIKEISFNKEKLHSSLKYYSDDVKENILTAANHEYIIQKTVAKKGTLQRKSIYLVGPPGVGKTLVVAKFAESLGLPFVRVSLEGRSVDDLIGRSLKSNDISEGIIANQLIESNKNNTVKAKNIVVFLDEVDHAITDKRYGEEILPFLLKLLDPESKSFYNPFFEANVDTSQWTIVLAGNHKLDHAALSNRMNYIYFDGFSNASKKDLFWNHFFPKIIKTYNNIIAKNDITLEEIDMINASIDADKDPGLRTIQQFGIDFIEHKIAAKDKIFDLAPFKGKEKIRKFNIFLDKYVPITNISEEHNEPNNKKTAPPAA